MAQWKRWSEFNLQGGPNVKFKYLSLIILDFALSFLLKTNRILLDNYQTTILSRNQVVSIHDIKQQIIDNHRF